MIFPIPIVGIDSFSVISFANNLGIHSKTTPKAPELSTALASSIIFFLFFIFFLRSLNF